VIVFAEVAVDLYRRRELVGRRPLSGRWVLAPGLLDGEGDRRDTQAVWEGRKVVHLVFVDRVFGGAGWLWSQNLGLELGFETDCGWRNNDVNVFLLHFRIPLVNKHAPDLLSRADLFVELLELR